MHELRVDSFSLNTFSVLVFVNTFKDRATKLEKPVFQRAHSFFSLHPTQLEACVNNIQKLAYFSKGCRVRFRGKQNNELAMWISVLTLPEKLAQLFPFCS